MELLDWAKEQCKLYTLRASDDDERKYLDGCCKSALKAFESLLEDGHSGVSINITLRILNSLVDIKPLVPLENKKEDWIDHRTYGDGDVITYSHRYYSCLKKKHHLDTGIDDFYDSNRFLCRPSISHDGVSWHNSFCSKIGHQMFPISFPYKPPVKPYKVIVDEYLTDRQNGDYDTMVIRSILTPEGRNVVLDQYYKETEDGFVQINKLEFEERRKLNDMRIANEARENQTP